MSKFQLILLVVFGVFIVAAVLVFSMSRSGSTSASVTIWGPISATDFATLMTDSGLATSKTLEINYVEKSLEEIDEEFTEALATGVGPDLVILPHDKIYKNRNKLIVIPEANVSRSDFVETFVEESELLFAEGGVYAIPFYVDPLVLYYNRDLLSKAGYAKPPQYWDELYEYASKLTERDQAGNIVRSTIALGEARNISNAKDIISLLMLGAGTSVTSYYGTDLRSVLLDSNNQSYVPGETALDFYTQFSNPLKPFYSWNRSMTEALTAFISGDLSMYIGFGSEYSGLKAKNPNLNIALAVVPQSRVSGKGVTFGRLYGVAIARSSKDPTGALTAALELTSEENSLLLSKALGYPPVRRDLLAEKQSDPSLSVLYTSAIQSRGWVDPEDIKTKAAFKNMIESVTSGRARTSEALRTLNEEIDSLVTE